MATAKQKRALNAIVENGGNVSKAMVAAGYTPATAKTPQKLTESVGYKELCEEYGLTDELLLTALVSDIQEKPQNRKAELELAFKVKGRLKESDDKPKANTTIANFTQIVINAPHGTEDIRNQPNAKAIPGVASV